MVGVARVAGVAMVARVAGAGARMSGPGGLDVQKDGKISPVLLRSPPIWGRCPKSMMDR